jgi:gas vesicle protein
MLPDYNNSNPHVNMPTRIIEKDASSSYSKGLIVGSLIGSAIGATVALLFAPKAGNEIRKDIAEKSSGLTTKANGLFRKIESDVQSAVNSAINEGKVKADGIIDNAKRQADNLVRSADQVLKDAKLKASDAKTNYGEKVTSYREATKAGVEAYKSEIANHELKSTVKKDEHYIGTDAKAPGFTIDQIEEEQSDSTDKLAGSKFDLDGSLS